MKIYIFLFTFLISAPFTWAQQEIDPNGYNTFYYNNGQVSSEGFMRDAQPDGHWKTYSKNGILKSEGNRKDFELDSIWTFYSDSGKVSVQITYLEGKKNGIRRTFHENEIVEENFVNDIKQGYTYYYFPNGTLWKEINFIDGLESGTGRAYARSDGRVVKLMFYQKGFITDIENINRIDKARMKQGKWITFWDNWNTKTEGDYKNDLKHGYFKEYTKDGVLISTAKYIDGILQEDVAELAKLDIKTFIINDPFSYHLAAFKNISGYYFSIRGVFPPNTFRDIIFITGHYFQIAIRIIFGFNVEFSKFSHVLLKDAVNVFCC